MPVVQEFLAWVCPQNGDKQAFQQCLLVMLQVKDDLIDQLRGKNHPGHELVERVWGINKGSRYGLWETGQASASPISHQSVGRTGVYIGLELL